MEKRILINGFGRSGTTFLYIQMVKNFENSLYEPLNPEIGAHIRASLKNKPVIGVHPYLRKDLQRELFYNYYRYFGDEIFDIIAKYHPNRDGITHHIYNVGELKKYLLHFRDFHIKDGSLHLYLNENFIRDVWDVYHIIRHPVDNFISILKSFYPKLKKYKIHILQRYIKPLRRILNIFGINGYYFVAKELYQIYGVRKPASNIYNMSMEEAFLISWIISNYYAIKSLSKEKIIIYNKPKTFNRLPFDIKDKFNPKEYLNEREKFSYYFEKIAKKWDLDSEYNYLLKLFD